MEDFKELFFWGFVVLIVFISNLSKKGRKSLVEKIDQMGTKPQKGIQSWDQNQLSLSPPPPRAAVRRPPAAPANQPRKIRKRQVAGVMDGDVSVHHLDHSDNLYSRFSGDTTRAQKELLGEVVTPEQLTDLAAKLDWLMGRATSRSKEEWFYRDVLTAVQQKRQNLLSRRGALFAAGLNNRSFIEGLVIGEILRRKHFNVDTF